MVERRCLHVRLHVCLLRRFNAISCFIAILIHGHEPLQLPPGGTNTTTACLERKQGRVALPIPNRQALVLDQAPSTPAHLRKGNVERWQAASMSAHAHSYTPPQMAHLQQLLVRFHQAQRSGRVQCHAHRLEQRRRAQVNVLFQHLQTKCEGATEDFGIACSNAAH